MSNFRKLAVVAIVFGGSMNAFAEWIRADSVGGNENFLSDYQLCTYRINKMFSSIDGEQFTIRIKDSSCPYSIEIDPETNQWRR